MNPAPKISVVVSTYNRPDHLTVTLRSILDQTWPDLEVIVVSDGPSDRNRAAVASLDDDRLRYLEVPHQGGPAAARNGGIAAARGELIAFCDDDDLWEPEKLAMQAEILLRRPEVVLVHTNASQIDEQSRLVMRLRRPSPRHYDERPLEGFLSVPFFHVLISSVLVRRSAIDVAGLFDEHPLLHGREDTEFIVRLASRTGAPFARVETPVVRYRHAAQSLGRSAGYRDPARRDYFHRIVLENGTLTPEQHRRFVSNLFAIESFNSLRHTFDPREAFRSATTSWRMRKGLVPAALLLVSAPLAAITKMMRIRATN